LTQALLPGGELHRLWSRKVLRPGDTVVQNGTRHRWVNRGTEPAVMAVFMCGAHRASE